MKISIEKIPENLEEFSRMLHLDIPENTCAMLLLALNLYVKDPETGAEALNLLRGPRPLSPYDRQFLKDRFRGKPYLPLAYLDGAEPGNNYQPRQPLTVTVLPDPNPQNCPEGYRKLFLRTAGADSPRPVTLRSKGNAWYVWEYSSILSGIRIPVQEDPWA